MTESGVSGKEMWASPAMLGNIADVLGQRAEFLAAFLRGMHIAFH